MRNKQMKHCASFTERSRFMFLAGAPRTAFLLVHSYWTLDSYWFLISSSNVSVENSKGNKHVTLFHILRGIGYWKLKWYVAYLYTYTGWAQEVPLSSSPTDQGDCTLKILQENPFFFGSYPKQSAQQVSSSCHHNLFICKPTGITKLAYVSHTPSCMQKETGPVKGFLGTFSPRGKSEASNNTNFVRTTCHSVTSLSSAEVWKGTVKKKLYALNSPGYYSMTPGYETVFISQCWCLYTFSIVPGNQSFQLFKTLGNSYATDVYRVSPLCFASDDLL